MRGLAGALVVLAAAWPTHQASVQQQQRQHRPGWPCVGRPDPAYFRIAEASGGQVFLFDPSEIGESSVLMTEGMRHEQTVVRVAGSLTEGVHTFDMPVDSTIESALFSVSLQCLQVVEIALPDGALLREGLDGVNDHQFQAGRIVVVNHPTAGTWHVTVSGSGLFFLVVQARTPLSLDRVAFVAPGGRPGHEGLFPITGSPAYGIAQWLEVTLDGDGRGERFTLISGASEPLQPVELRPEPGGKAAVGTRTFLGQVTPRARQFRVSVTGTDSAGFPYQRVHAPLYSTAGSE